jgi:hypothetical protein
MPAAFRPLWASVATPFDNILTQSPVHQRRQLLLDGRYPELDAQLQAIHQQFASGAQSEGDYAGDLTAGLIGPDDPRMEPLLLAWISTCPQSYVARQVYAHFCHAMLYAYRGEDTGNTITPFREVKMYEWGWKCFDAIQQALALPAAKPLMSYDLMIELLRVWNGSLELDEDPFPPLSAPEQAILANPRPELTPEQLDPARWLELGLAAVPDSLILRDSYLYQLTPQWGGSEEAMRAFVAEQLPRLDSTRGAKLQALMLRKLAFHQEVFLEDEAGAARLKAEADTVFPETAESDPVDARLRRFTDAMDVAGRDPEKNAAALAMIRDVEDGEILAHNDAEALYYKGKALCTIGQVVESEPYLLAAVRMHWGNALGNILWLYCSESPLADPQRYRQWLDELVAMDSSEGYLALATSLYFGYNGIAQDIRASEQPAIEAAKRGAARLMANIAQHYFMDEDNCGIVLGTDPRLGVRWLHWCAAQMEYPFAQTQLGRHLIYAKDQSYAERFPHDPEAGVKWLQEAVDQGDISAHYWLARAYQDGYAKIENQHEIIDLYEAVLEYGDARQQSLAAFYAGRLAVEHKDFEAVSRYAGILKQLDDPDGWYLDAEALWHASGDDPKAPQKQQAIRIMEEALQRGSSEAEERLQHYRSVVPQGGLLKSFKKLFGG